MELDFFVSMHLDLSQLRQNAFQDTCARKAVLTPQGRFPTMTAAALHYGVDYQTVISLKK